MADAAKANELMAQADKKAQKGGGLFNFLGGGSKHEDCAEIYGRAGNLYKLAKEWDRAGEAYEKQSQQMKMAGADFEAIQIMVNAASAYKKGNPENAVRCYRAAINGLLENGRFTMAAKHEVSVAEIYEGELTDLEKAMSSYRQAGDWFQGEDSTSQANKCRLKVAQYAAQLERYQEAIEIYEGIAAVSCENNLLKWSAKDYFLKAGICHLANGDLEGAKKAVQNYCDMFAAFEDSREYRFLKDLIDAVEEEDIEKYTQVVAEYDSVSRLEAWMTSMLLRIKNSVGEESLT
eukprot:Clim_evm33s197 gene=Clim_evmTU33s197